MKTKRVYPIQNDGYVYHELGSKPSYVAVYADGKRLTPEDDYWVNTLGRLTIESEALVGDNPVVVVDWED